jgi:hypothetical protein
MGILTSFYLLFLALLILHTFSFLVSVRHVAIFDEVTLCLTDSVVVEHPLDLSCLPTTRLFKKKCSRC